MLPDKNLSLLFQRPAKVAKCLFMCPLCASVWKPTITSPGLCIRGNSPLSPSPHCSQTIYAPSQPSVFAQHFVSCCEFPEESHGPRSICAKCICPNCKMYLSYDSSQLIFLRHRSTFFKVSWHASVYDSGEMILLWHSGPHSFCHLTPRNPSCCLKYFNWRYQWRWIWWI